MKLIILTLVILSNFFAPLPAKSETVLEKIKRTGLLEVAMREDAIPFGYRDSNNNLQGLCLDFIQLLRGELKHKLNLQIISVKIYKSTLFNRFQLLENKTVDFECGPNSIRKNIQVLTHIGQLNKSAYAGIGKRLCRNRSALKAESALKVLVFFIPGPK